MLDHVIERVFPKKLSSVNPANLQVIGEVAFSTKDDIINKVKLAHRAKKKRRFKVIAEE